MERFAGGAQGPPAVCALRPPDSSMNGRRKNAARGALALLLAGVSLRLACLRLDWVVGDASIYWVFAKSAWEHGFLHFGADGPKHGATSPLWAGVLMLARPLCGDRTVLYKLLGFGTFLLVALSTYRLALFTSRSRGAAFCVAGFLLFYMPLAGPSSLSFETPLFALILIEAVLATLRLLESDADPAPASAGELARWVALAALLPLARPEGALVLCLLAPWAAYALRRRVPSWRRAAWMPAAVLLPGAGYYLGMYAATGVLVPSSVAARRLLSELHDVWPAPKAFIVGASAGLLFRPSRPLFIACDLLQAGLLALGWVASWRRRPSQALVLVSVPLALGLLMLWQNPGFLYRRYAAPLGPIGLAFAGVGARELVRALEAPLGRLRPGARAAGRLALALPFLAVFVLHARRAYGLSRAPAVRTDAEVLDRAGSELLADLLEPSDLALVHEVQSQYFLSCRTISSDGVVGGEILPYLRCGDVAGFLRRYRVTHVFVSAPFGRWATYRGTLLQRLWEVAQSQQLGDAFVSGGLRFTRIAERELPERIRVPHWTSVYRVDRAEGPGTERLEVREPEPAGHRLSVAAEDRS